MLSRRTFLAAGVAAFAGCGAARNETPPATTAPQTDTPAPTATPRPTPGSRKSFAAFLDRLSVRVQLLDRENKTVTLRYVSAGNSDQLSEEIGTVAGGFLREVEEGWAVSRLEATIVSADGAALARWHVRSAWLDQYRSGEITGSELSLKVLNSLERVGTASG